MPIIPDGFEYMMTEIQRASLGFGYGLCFVVIAYIILSRRDVLCGVEHLLANALFLFCSRFLVD